MSNDHKAKKSACKYGYLKWTNEPTNQQRINERMNEKIKKKKNNLRFWYHRLLFFLFRRHISIAYFINLVALIQWIFCFWLRCCMWYRWYKQFFVCFFRLLSRSLDCNRSLKKCVIIIVQEEFETNWNVVSFYFIFFYQKCLIGCDLIDRHHFENKRMINISCVFSSCVSLSDCVILFTLMIL